MRFKCSAIDTDHRLFEENNARRLKDNLNEWLQPHTLYLVNEGNGLDSHFLCDIFSRTENDEIVLVDLTGLENDVRVRRKVENHVAFMAEVAESEVMAQGFGWRSVVLAPGLGDADEVSVPEEACDIIRVIKGQDARRYLRGLQQIYRFTLPFEDDKKV